MKRWLVIVRHAKSSWKQPVPDHERPLNQRGQRDAPVMAARLAEYLVRAERRPDLLLSSSALRARQTAEQFAGTLSARDRLQIDNRLYDAGAASIVDIARALPANAWTVLLFGHNPGMEMAVDALCGEQLERMPTASFAVLQLAAPDWQALGSGSCRLLEFDFPKRVAA